MSNINRLRTLKSLLLEDTFGSPIKSPTENDCNAKNSIDEPQFHRINPQHNLNSYTGAKGRALLKEQLESEIFHQSSQESNEEFNEPVKDQLNTKETLLQTSHKLRQDAKLKNELDIIRDQEEKLLEQVSHSLTSNLQPVAERAKGITHKRLPVLWTLPKKYKKMTLDEIEKVRARNYIDINGTNVPPPIRSFRDMKFPKPILKYLAKKNIKTPTQIQMQAIPAVLQGRDIIAIAYTGD